MRAGGGPRRVVADRPSAGLSRRSLLAFGAASVIGACSRTGGGPRASPLPLARPEASDLFESVLRNRRSIRAFLSEPVASADVARLLWAAQGKTASWGGRTAPSAGALYPIEVYAADETGVVRYDASAHAVHGVAEADRRSLIAAATGWQEAVTQAPVVLVITGVVDRTAQKYGDRAERYVQLEAGHVCQNVLLQATALGLGAVPVGSFEDEAIRAILGATSGELPLYVVPIGHPAPES